MGRIGLHAFPWCTRSGRKTGPEDPPPGARSRAFLCRPCVLPRGRNLSVPAVSVSGNGEAHRLMPLEIVAGLDEHSRAQHGELTEQGAVIVGKYFVVERREEPDVRRAGGR